MSYSSYAPDHRSQFGVIALSESQAEIYFGGRDDVDRAPSLTSDRIEEILTLFKEIGLLDHLNTVEIADGKTHIDRSHITYPYQLLEAFQDVALFFDWESAEGDDPYQYFTQWLADISHGNFNPVDIDDGFDWENETASLAFTLNGNRYSTDLKFRGDWIDPQFFKFIEEVVATEVPQGQFYPLSYDAADYGTEGYIFLTEAQLDILRSQQLITISTEAS